MSLRFSVLLCCYGDYPDYARAAIASVLETGAPRERYDVHVGLNQCGAATVQAMRCLADERRIDTLVESNANLNKDPMMRILIERARTPYLVWMDDDSRFLPGGLRELARFLDAEAPFDVAGHVWYVHRQADYMRGYEEFLKRRPWFRGFDRITDRERLFFATGGLWAARTGFLREHDFPDRAMVKRQDDLLLADLVLQAGGRLVAFPEALTDRLSINQAPRRGDGESLEDFQRDPDREAAPAARGEAR